MDSEHFVLLYLRDYICSNFQSLITKTELCDVIFEVGNEFNKKQFYAIKSLFAIHSEIFYQLLYSSKSKSSHRNNGICTIQILDIEPDAMEYLRALFYGLNPSITLKNIIPIYHASNIYEIEALKQYCLQFLYSIIPSKDEMNIFLSLLNQLIYYQYDDMIMDILNNLQLTHYHFHSMLEMDDESKIFSNSPYKLIQQLLFNSNHDLFGDHVTQENKWSACMKWSLFQDKKVNIHTRKHQNGSKINKINKFSSTDQQLKGSKYLKQFVQYFDFESFDSEFFYSNVAKLKILNDKLALEMLNFHCNGLLNRIDDKYDTIIMNYPDGHHALTGNPIQTQSSLTGAESSSIIKIQTLNGGYLCVDEYNDDNIKIKFANSVKDDYYEWIGIEDPNNGFWRFQNVATSKFLTVTPKLKGVDTSDILKCDDIDGKSLFCIFMIHITPWKHCKFEPIFIHPNYFLSVKDKEIQLSTKNGLYEEFKMIPIGNDDNKIEVKDGIDIESKDQENEENMNDIQYKSTLTPRKNALSFDSNDNHRRGSMSTFNFGQELKQLNESDNDNEDQHQHEHIRNRNGSIIDHPLAIHNNDTNNLPKTVSKWTGDKQLTIEDKFGSYFLAIKGLHSTSCTANKVMDDLSEWIVEFHRESKDLVRFKNKKSNKYLRISNNGFRIDCGGDEDDKYCVFKISHSEHDWNLCRLESIEYQGYCLGLSENGVTVSHDVASDSLIYVKVE